MAIFQKKRVEDELAVLPRPSQVPAQAPTQVSTPPMAQRSPSPVQVTAAPSATGYGIDQLIRLMRELPNGNVELVVRVLKKTLESVNIHVPTLIQDASRRESELEERMTGHRRAIAALEEEIAGKRRAIEELEGAYKEVMVVKERLNLALSLEGQQVSVTGAPPGMAPRQAVSSTIMGKPDPLTPIVTDVPTRGRD